jgi:antitoxin (DNA-binding transcriptional repressor) of toxin-antitoxin stability system
MGKHTVTEAAEKLPELIDRALGGEDVLITRDGSVVAEIRAVARPPRPITQADIDWVRARRPARLAQTIDSATLVRQMRDEGE